VFLSLLLAFAHAGARDLSEEAVHTPPADHALTAQLGLSGALDPKLRVTGGKRKGLTWQASTQLMTRDGEGLKLYPAFDAGNTSVLAMRVGGLLRHPLDERFTLELGMAIEPISGFGMAARGLQSDLPVLGMIFGAPTAWFHTMETSGGVELALGRGDAPVALWIGGVVSAAGMWTDGEAVFDPEPERDPDAPVTDEDLRKSMELLQPSVALTWRF